MDRAIKKTIRQRVGIIFLHPAFLQPGLLQPVRDLIDFLFGKETKPAAAAPASRKPGTIVMGKAFPDMRARKIKIREMVTQIGEEQRLDKRVQNALFNLATKQGTTDKDIEKFILKTEVENIIKKQKLVLTYVQKQRLETLYNQPDAFNKLNEQIIKWSIDRLTINDVQKTTLLRILKEGMDDKRSIVEDIWTRIRTQVLRWEIDKIPDMQRKQKLLKMFHPVNTEAILDNIEEAMNDPSSPQVLHLSTATLSPYGSPLAIVPSPKYYAVVAPSPAPPLAQAATTSPAPPLQFPDVPTTPLPKAPSPPAVRSPKNRRGDLRA